MKLHLKLDRTRLLENVTVKTLIDAQEKDVKALRDFLAVFVYDDATNTYLDIVAGTDMINNMTLQQLMESGNEILGGVDNTVVPPLSGKDS